MSAYLEVHAYMALPKARKSWLRPAPQKSLSEIPLAVWQSLSSRPCLASPSATALWTGQEGREGVVSKDSTPPSCLAPFPCAGVYCPVGRNSECSPPTGRSWAGRTQALCWLGSKKEMQGQS